MGWGDGMRIQCSAPRQRSSSTRKLEVSLSEPARATTPNLVSLSQESSNCCNCPLQLLAATARCNCSLQSTSSPVVPQDLQPLLLLYCATNDAVASLTRKTKASQLLETRFGLCTSGTLCKGSTCCMLNEPGEVLGCSNQLTLSGQMKQTRFYFGSRTETSYRQS